MDQNFTNTDSSRLVDVVYFDGNKTADEWVLKLNVDVISNNIPELEQQDGDDIANANTLADDYRTDIIANRTDEKGNNDRPNCDECNKAINPDNIPDNSNEFSVVINNKMPTSTRTNKCKRNLGKKFETRKKVLRGEAHTNEKGRNILEKKVNYFDCKCKFGCTEYITKEHQQANFVEYRSIETRELQRAFLAKLMVESPVKRRRVNSDELQKLRNYSVAYYLKDPHGELIRICRKFFLNTFAISEKVCANIVKNLSPISGIYQWKHKNTGRLPPNTTPLQKIRQIEAFINCVPKVPSHSCRKSSKGLYFYPDLNLTKLYKQYKEEIGENCVSMRVFADVVKKWDPPLSFSYPKKDQSCCVLRKC